MSDGRSVDRSRLLLGGGIALGSLVGRTAAGSAAVKRPSSVRVVNVMDHGAHGNGASDDTGALLRALAAVSTPRTRLPVYLPAGSYRITKQLRIPSNTTVFGDGSRPGSSGGSEIVWASGPGPAVVAGSGGQVWSDSELRGIRISGRGSGRSAGGYGLRVINPTNGSVVGDVGVFGFRDGQILVDNGGDGPGPNFFRLSDFFVGGGVNPLHIRGGRQTVLVEYGGVDLDGTSKQGVLLEGGEGQARTLLMTAVKVEGDTDVPGFTVTSLAPCTFIACARHNNAGLRGKPQQQPAFLYTNPSQPDLQLELIACTCIGAATLFRAPERGVTIPGATDGRYSGALLSGSHTMIAPFNTRSDSRRSLILHRDVRLSWTDDSGSSGALDTNLYRAGANTLMTDDQLVAAGAVTTKVVDGPPTDADLATARDGSLVVDGTNGQLYIRCRGKWKHVALED